MSPVDKVVYGKKSLVPDCNTLPFHKGKKNKLKINLKICKNFILLSRVIFINSPNNH